MQFIEFIDEADESAAKPGAAKKKKNRKKPKAKSE